VGEGKALYDSVLRCFWLLFQGVDEGVGARRKSLPSSMASTPIRSGQHGKDLPVLAEANLSMASGSESPLIHHQNK
jgi:hypothetical protein